MKRLFIFSGILIFSLSMYSCSELAAGLSNFNQANGSQCSVKSCYSEVYHDGEYKSGILTKDEDGDDVSSTEERWVDNKMDSYLGYSFGVYYATSPYTKGEYKFTVFCKSYY